MRLRHILKELAFIWLRIRRTTADSFNPNCASIASKGVRSSQAISMMRETSAAEKPAKAGFSWLGDAESPMFDEVKPQAFFAQALHQALAATALPANSAHLPSGAFASPTHSAQLAQFWSLLYLGYFLVSVLVPSVL
jgi:hypothetical protein